MFETKWAISCSGEIEQQGQQSEDSGISHVQNSVLHILESDFIELMIEAADYFIKNPTQSTTLHREPYYIPVYSALM